MADVWEKDLAQKTSLTTSDFIRVVGSDNVSYKQLVSDVADKIISSRYLAYGATTIPSSADLNTYRTVGVYACPSGAVAQSLSNCPTTSAFRLEVKQIINAERYVQIIYVNVNYDPTLYWRTYNGSWSSWYAPALSSKFINSTSTQTIIETILTFPIGTPCAVHFSGEASTTLIGGNAQIGGTAYKADTSIVDMFVGGYGSSKVYSIRITKQSVGNYTVARKEIDISDSGWIELKTGVKYRRVNGVCYVNIESYTTTQTSGTETIGTLPAGCRPAVGVNIQWCARKGTSTLTAGWLTSGGTINYTAVSASGTLAGFITFPVG